MEKALTPKNIEIAAKAFYEASCDDKWDDTIELEREWYLASMEVRHACPQSKASISRAGGRSLG